MHLKNFNAKESLDSFLNQDRLPVNVSTEEAWQKQKGKISNNVAVFSLKQRTLKYSAYAAGIAALFVLIFSLFNNESRQNISSSIAEHIEYTLPDGSQVWLNAESELNFDTETWSSEREVELIGEAFFEVKKGSAFTVNTTNGSVAVLGTSFNVFARESNLVVACETGSVRVKTAFQQVILQPETKVTLDNNELIKENIENDRISAWKNGEFIFEDADLKLVLKELQRQFDIEIDFSSEKAYTYTGKFTTNNLDDALELVCSPLGLHYQIEKNGKLITIK